MTRVAIHRFGDDGMTQHRRLYDARNIIFVEAGCCEIVGIGGKDKGYIQRTIDDRIAFIHRGEAPLSLKIL